MNVPSLVRLLRVPVVNNNQDIAVGAKQLADYLLVSKIKTYSEDIGYYVDCSKKVAEENNFFSKNISVNPYLFKGIDKINKNVNEKIASIKEQVKGKKASI